MSSATNLADGNDDTVPEEAAPSRRQRHPWKTDHAAGTLSRDDEVYHLDNVPAAKQRALAMIGYHTVITRAVDRARTVSQWESEAEPAAAATTRKPTGLRAEAVALALADFLCEKRDVAPGSEEADAVLNEARATTAQRAAENKNFLIKALRTIPAAKRHYDMLRGDSKPSDLSIASLFDD